MDFMGQELGDVLPGIMFHRDALSHFLLEQHSYQIQLFLPFFSYVINRQCCIHQILQSCPCIVVLLLLSKTPYKIIMLTVSQVKF